MTNIKNFDANLLSINQIAFTSTDSVAYGIEYFKNLDGVNSLYLIFNKLDVYFQKYGENNYFIFALTDRNKEALENYTELWNEIKKEIETIRGIEPIKYEKDLLKIRFESGNNLPLDRILNIPVCVIIVKSAFQENGKCYPQVFLE